MKNSATAKHGFSEASTTGWKAKFGGMNVWSNGERWRRRTQKLKKLPRQLDARNRRDARGAAGKQWPGGERRECVRALRHEGSERRLSSGWGEQQCCYSAARDGNDAELRERLNQLAGQHRCHGYRMLHARLRQEGAQHQRQAHPIGSTRSKGLAVRKRRRLKLPRH